MKVEITMDDGTVRDFEEVVSAPVSPVETPVEETVATEDVAQEKPAEVSAA